MKEISGRLCAFIQKLWRIMNDSSLHAIIHWSCQGTIMSIVDSKLFCESVLPRYFKHNNWQSFVRQLNLYGFRKVNHFSIATDYANGRQETIWQFKHLHFQQNHAESLVLIQRKVSSSALRTGPGTKAVDALPDIITKLEETERLNAEMRKETQWLRQQHENQQRMVSTLLQQLTSMTQSNLNGISNQLNSKHDREDNIDNNSNHGRGARISLPPLAAILRK